MMATLPHLGDSEPEEGEIGYMLMTGCEGRQLDVLIEALSPFAHRLGRVFLSNYRGMHLTSSLIAVLGKVLGPHTYAFGVRAFDRPSAEWEPRWRQLLTALPLLTVFKLYYSDPVADPQFSALHAFVAACRTEKRKVQLVAEKSRVSEEAAAGLGSEWVTVARG